MKTLFIGTLLIVVSGCGSTAPEDALENYRCTPKQLERVEKEFEVCKRSEYLNSHCFLTAKKTYCRYVGEVATNENR